MNATDLVIATPGRLFSRTSPRVRRIERSFPLTRSDQATARAVSAISEPEEVVPCTCGLAVDGRPVHVYNEEAFQHFLSIERKRTEACGNHLLLALVDLKKPLGAGEDRTTRAQDVFAVLRSTLRETDFVGWYRDADVAGAVLPQFRGSVPDISTRRVGQRLCLELAQRLPTAASQLEVHVYEVQPDGQS